MKMKDKISKLDTGVPPHFLILVMFCVGQATRENCSLSEILQGPQGPQNSLQSEAVGRVSHQLRALNSILP